MMSAALLTTANVEQASVLPASGDLFADQDETADVSFAKSFNDRVKESVLPRGKSSAEEAAIALPGFKVVSNANSPPAIPPKKLDEVAETLDEVRGKTPSTQNVSAHSVLKSMAAYKIVESQAAVVTRPQEKTVTVSSGTKEVEPTVERDLAADDISPVSPAANAALAAGSTDEGFVAPINIDEDQPLASRIDSPVVRKETETLGKTKEIVSTKKTVKTQENTATSKITQKANGNATPKPAATIVREDAVPIVQGVVAGVVVPRNDAGKTAEDGLNKIVPGVVNTSSGVSVATVSGSIHKEAGYGTKAVAEDSETAVPAAESQPALPKSEMGLEKIATVATAPGNNGDSKIQGTPEPSVAMVHSTTGAVVASGTAPTPVAAGNAPGELTAAKLPAGDAGPHTTGLPVGWSEQDRPGIVVASMDEVPRMLTATPTALEVGIQNGTHGWLRVRAEMADGGVVNASISAASSAGQEMLHRELPTLTAYLQEEKVAVNAIAVHTPLVGGNEPRSSTGMDGAGGQTQQRGNEGGEQQHNVRKQIVEIPDGAMTYQGLHGVAEDGSSSLAGYASGGSWLSVRA